MSSIVRGALVGLLCCLVSGCGGVPHAQPSSAAPASSPVPAMASAPMSGSRPTPPSAAPPPAEPVTVTALDFLSPDEGWIAVQRPPGSTPQGAIAGTTDGGRHWRTLVRWTGTPPWHFPYSDGPLVPTALDFVDPQHGWALVPLGGGACQAEFGVLRTSDGGAQWLPAGVLLGSDGPVSLAFGTRQVGWVSNGSCAGAYTSVSASTDGGTAWRPWSRWYPASPDAALAPTATALGAASATHAWMVNAYWNYAAPAPHAPVLQALTTDDGGTTWTGHLLPTSGLAGRIAALGFLTPDVGWVVTAQGSRTTLAGTLDAGRHWQTLALPGPSGTVGPVDRVTIQVGYAVQTLPPTLHAPAGSSRLWVTDDGGRSWQPVALPEP